MEAAAVALFDRDFWLPLLNTTPEAAHISSVLHWQLEKKSVLVYRRDGRSNSPERQDEVQKECGKGSACSPGKPVFPSSSAGMLQHGAIAQTDADWGF